MAYCTKCGAKLVEGNAFCGNCGSPVGEQIKRKEKTTVAYCPACGEVVGKNETKCPACGFEIRDASEGSIALLSEKLDKIEAMRPRKNKDDEEDGISATDKRKINLIQTWPIPNTKEDLYEFMSMASGNCVPSQGLFASTTDNALTSAWLSTFEQSYAKAERLFGADDDFELIKKIKADVNKKIILAKIGGMWPFLLILCMPLMVILPFWIAKLLGLM